MTTKQFWATGAATAALAPIFPGLIICYLVFSVVRAFSFAVENDREEDRLNALKQKGVDPCA